MKTISVRARLRGSGLILAAMLLASACAKEGHKADPGAPTTPLAAAPAPAPGAASATAPAPALAAAANPAAARVVPVAVTGEGYNPDKIEAKPGEKIVLAFTRTADAGCGNTIKVAGGTPVDLPLGKAVEFSIDVPQSGEVHFACSMDMMQGAVIVAGQ